MIIVITTATTVTTIATILGDNSWLNARHHMQNFRYKYKLYYLLAGR